MSPRPDDHFQFAIQFDDDRPVVTVVGEVTPTTAPTLVAVVTGLADHGHPHLVLDLADVGFMDVSGIRTMIDISGHLDRANGSLAIRAAPDQVRRILALAGPVPNVILEPPSPFAVGHGLDVGAPTPIAGRPRALSGDLARVGGPPTTAIVDAALRSLTQLANASVEGADGASVTLERNGRLATVAATDGTVLRMDTHQYNTGEGPCLAAGAHGVSFYVESLAAESRWPAFVPRALEEGIGSILSTPLTMATQAIGALNIYSRTERAFGPSQQELADLFAAEASAIVAAGASVIDGHLGDKISRALQSREIIALARGVLMAQSHINADEAAAVLIRSARATEITVLQQATEIVALAGGDASSGREPRHCG